MKRDHKPKIYFSDRGQGGRWRITPMPRWVQGDMTGRWARASIFVGSLNKRLDK
jgi:hypothetical protein